jgi:hypothetical protein
VNERVLEKEWPALRAELSVTPPRARRLKGLELLGVPPTAAIALELSKAESDTASASEPPSRFNLPARPKLPSEGRPTRHPAPVLEIQGEDISLFAGLPLFEL